MKRVMTSPNLTWNERNLRSSAAQRKALWDFVEKWTGNPLLVDFSAKLIKLMNIPERDELALARGIQKFAQYKIKFFREKPERFASPLRTIVWGIGDCDDKSIVIASILRTFRIPIKLKFIRYEKKQEDGTIKKISHVYPLAKINGSWAALESVHKWQLGDDPEHRALAKGLRPEVFLIGDN